MENKSHVYIKTNEKNEIVRIEGEYSLPSDLNGWILIEEGEPCDRLNHAQNCYLPKPILDFEHGLYRYAYINNQIVEKDLTEEIAQWEENQRIEGIRQRRETECFSIINRGTLWYSRLSDEQIAELNVWYSEWLDAPQTGVIPEKPSWLE